MSKIGILGGTFDPFHLGHLSIADTALHELNLDQLVLMPTKVSPFKLGREMADEHDRVEMARLVASENKNFILSTIETDSPGVSYTYKTFETLKKQMPDDDIMFIMGGDSFISLDKWYKGHELLREAEFILAIRPGVDRDKTLKKVDHYRETYGARIYVVHNELLEISSTEIKKAIKEGRSIEAFVPKCVERYINEHGLYK